jgi:putative superfamily III holin-X
MFAVVERSIASLLKDIIGNVQQIIRAEVRLAKVEVAGELVKARRAMTLLAVGGLFGAAALAFLLLGAVYGLAHIVQPWVAAVLVALGAGAIGGALIVVGARQLRVISLPPARTVNSVQENIQWAKAQAR